MFKQNFFSDKHPISKNLPNHLTLSNMSGKSDEFAIPKET